MKKTKEKQPNLFKRWNALCEPKKSLWFWQIFLCIIYAAIYASMTIIAAQTINCLYNGDWNGAFMWLALELADILLRNIVIHVEYIIYSKHYGIIQKNITAKIFDKLLQCEERGIKNISSEKIINIAQNNLSNAAEFPDYIATICQLLVHVGIAMITIFLVNPYAGLAVVALGVVNFFVYNYLNKRMGRLMNIRYEKKDNSFKEYSKIISGRPVIQELGVKENYKTNLINYVDDYNKAYDKYYRTYSFRENMYFAIWNIVTYAITFFLIYLISQNTFDLALYLIIVPYLSTCTQKLTGLYTKFEGVEKVRVDIDRINVILSLNDKQIIQYGNVNKTSDGYNLGLIDVSIKSNNPENINLKNLDISFKMNGLNIIKGERGSGKRYIFDILRRKIKPDSGMVLLDNLDLFAYNEKTFKNHIDYCAAHPAFINASVKENLTITKNNFESIKALVEELGLKEKFEALPQGYDTHISDINSGEMKFWIGLVRATLSKCKVLMIYEYPDDVSDDFDKILKNIIATSESKKRTLIFFTHKDDYDNIADMLYEIRNGKVHVVKIPNKKRPK